MSRLLEKFGGTSRAADLLELAAACDLALLKTPLEGSAGAGFFMAGYDLFIYAQLLAFFLFFLCMRCCGCCCRRKPATLSNGKQKTQ